MTEPVLSPDPDREPAWLGYLLTEVLGRLAEACATERVHERRARQTDKGAEA